jgi:NitT/TauT family transport system permease protein
MATTTTPLESDLSTATATAITRLRLQLTRRRVLGPLVALASLALGAGLWEYVGRRTPRTEFVGFWPTIRAFGHLVGNGAMGNALQESMEVFGIGLGIGLVVGFFGGLVMARVPALRIGLGPYIAAAYAMPSVALAPFVLAVFGFEVKAKVIVVVLFAIWPVLINTLEGARSVNPELLEVAKSYHSSEPRLWLHVIVPYTLPYTMTGLRQSIARSLVGMIAAEFILSSSGLGDLIITNTERFETANVLASILTITLLATFLMGIGRAVENRFARWKAGA